MSTTCCSEYLRFKTLLSLSRAILLGWLAAFVIVTPVMAQSPAPPSLSSLGLAYLTSNQLTLDQLAATVTDQGGVEIYLTGYGGGYNMRLCVYAGGSSGNGLQVYRCQFSEPQQKWLLNREQQVVAQASPNLCWTWGSAGSNASITLSACGTGTVPSNQQFVFSANGTIASPDGTQCLNVNGDNSGDGTTVIGYSCSASSSNERWTIQPDPVQFVSLGTPTTDNRGVTLASISNYYAVNNASTAYSASLTLSPNTSSYNPSLNGYWFLTPANDGTNQLFIQNAQTGYCLSAYGGINIVVDGCKVGAGGYDSPQKWQVSSIGGGYYTLYNAAQNSYLSIVSPNDIYAPSYPAMKSESYGVLLARAPGALNVVFTNTNSAKITSCLAINGANNLQKLDCASVLSDTYQASFDILPNSNIRSRVTGNCLDNYYNTRPGVAAQYTCAAATSTAAVNQQWYAGTMGDTVYLSQTSTAPSWLYGTNLYLDAGKTGYVLTESLSAGQLSVASASNYAAGTATYPNAQWYLAPSYQLANCSDGPVNLPGVNTRVKRSIQSDTQNVYDLLGIMYALLYDLQDEWPGAPAITVFQLTPLGAGTYSFHTPTGVEMTFNGVTLTTTQMVAANAATQLSWGLRNADGTVNPNGLNLGGPTASIYVTMLQAGPVLDDAVAAAGPMLTPAATRMLGELAAIRAQILNITEPYISQPFAIPQVGCAALYGKFDW